MFGFSGAFFNDGLSTSCRLRRRVFYNPVF